MAVARITKAFRARHRWAALWIAIMCGPAIGMFYLSAGVVGLYYLALTVSVNVLPFVASHFGLIEYDNTLFSIIGFALKMGGVAHCYYKAKADGFSHGNKWFSYWYWLAAFIAVPLLVAVTFRAFLYEPLETSSSSMSPSINNGDYLFTEKRAYISKEPQRGDVVTFEIGGVQYMKRIVGIPDDTVQMVGGNLYINGFPTRTQKTTPFISTHYKDAKAIAQYQETLPSGRTYNILDETVESPIDDTIIFNVPKRHYFLLGDNRDNSMDSRLQDHIGFVLRDDITGKASAILWNSLDGKFLYKSAN